MWKPFLTNHYGLGTLCSVEIDSEKKYIKRNFFPGAITVSGKPNKYNDLEIKKFFENEVYWITRLKSKWVPETIEINEEKKYIIQKFYNHSLLDYKKKLNTIVPNIHQQIIDLYTFFKDNNVFKCNGSLSNMTFNEGQIIAFDFKWAQERPKNIEKEIYSYDNYLIKINNQLPNILRGLI